MLQLAIFLLGLVLIIVSATLWNKNPKTVDQAGNSDLTQGYRLLILIVWTLILPLYSLYEWHTQPPPSAADFPAFQYGHKVLGDVWTAVAVALGLIFGIKK